MNKKITLICALFLMCFAAVKAETRIYFAYSNSASQAPLPVEDGLTTIDYRNGNGFKINNWDNLNGPWNPGSGGFVEGGKYGYRQYGFDNTKSKFQVIHQLESNANEKIADLSMVTADWTFHVAIKTNHTGKLLFQINCGGKLYSMDITDMVTDRTGKWNEVEIEMEDFIEESNDGTEIDFTKCVYSSTNDASGAKDMWIIRGEELTGDNIGWDDCYFTDNVISGSTGKPGKVLFLTDRSDISGSPSDQTIVNALTEEGYEVTVKRSQEFSTADLEGLDCIFISEAIGSGDPASLYTAELAGEVGVAIINCEPYAYTDARLPWATSTGRGLTDYNQMVITEEGAAHPIMQKAKEIEPSIDGSVVVLEKVDASGSSPKMSWAGAADMLPSATVIANLDGSSTSNVTMFAIEKGAALSAGKTATARRIGFFIANANNHKLTDAGKAILLASVEWGIEGNGVGSGVEKIKSDLKYVVTKDQILVNEEGATLEIFNIAGVKCESIPSVKAFDCAALSKGVYIARLTKDGKSVTFKFSK